VDVINGWQLTGVILNLPLLSSVPFELSAYCTSVIAMQLSKNNKLLSRSSYKSLLGKYVQTCYVYAIEETKSIDFTYSFRMNGMHSEKQSSQETDGRLQPQHLADPSDKHKVQQVRAHPFMTSSGKSGF